MYRGCIISILIALACGSAEGSNMLRFSDGSIRALGPFEAWGYEIPSWRDLPDDILAFEALLQPRVVHGINSIGFTLHNPAGGETFFRPDGEPMDAAGTKKFIKIAGYYRFRFVATLISLFSSDPQAWLQRNRFCRSLGRLGQQIFLPFQTQPCVVSLKECQTFHSPFATHLIAALM